MSLENQNTHQKGRMRTYTIAAVKLVTGSALLLVLIVFAWNLFVPEIFGLEPMRAKHALGLLLLLAIASFVLRVRKTGVFHHHTDPR